MDIKEKIDKTNIPPHIAIIMDGNGRWAKKKGKFRIFGHQNAVIAVREAVEGAAEIGVKYLTLYAFSTENWRRPQVEVNALMQLLVNTINKEKKGLKKNNIRLRAIGDFSLLPKNCQKELNEAISFTKDCTHMTLVLAMSYSSRWEIMHAAKKIAEDAAMKKIKPSDITEELFGNYLTTADFPDPELMIRTSGEYRISNFLLWQLAYAELHFTDVLWPDFRKTDLYEAILSYQKRERRFGMTSEQLGKKK